MSHWVRDLGDSRWLKHVTMVVRGAVRMQHMLCEGNPVLVHCSDGWDRTSQLSSLSQLLLDPCVNCELSEPPMPPLTGGCMVRGAQLLPHH